MSMLHYLLVVARRRVLHQLYMLITVFLGWCRRYLRDYQLHLPLQYFADGTVRRRAHRLRLGGRLYHE